VRIRIIGNAIILIKGKLFNNEIERIRAIKLTETIKFNFIKFLISPVSTSSAMLELIDFKPPEESTVE